MKITCKTPPVVVSNPLRDLVILKQMDVHHLGGLMPPPCLGTSTCLPEAEEPHGLKFQGCHFLGETLGMTHKLPDPEFRLL